MNYELELYRQLFCCLKRGNIKGVFSNAKPIFLLTLINYPSIILKNRLFWKDVEFEKKYEETFNKMETTKITPLWKPFYYLSSEPFYDLIWKTSPPSDLIRRPSGHLLKEFLDHAEIDDALWHLIQNESNRKYLQECIINQYF